MELKAYSIINHAETSTTLDRLPAYLSRLLRSASKYWADGEILTPDALQVECKASGIAVYFLPVQDLEAELLANIEPMYPKPANVKALHDFAVNNLGAVGLHPRYKYTEHGLEATPCTATAP